MVRHTARRCTPDGAHGASHGAPLYAGRRAWCALRRAAVRRTARTVRHTARHCTPDGAYGAPCGAPVYAEWRAWCVTRRAGVRRRRTRARPNLVLLNGVRASEPLAVQPASRRRYAAPPRQAGDVAPAAGRLDRRRLGGTARARRADYVPGGDTYGREDGVTRSLDVPFRGLNP